MAGSSHRTERVADQIREEIATLITGGLRDPRIGFTTISRVELSADLEHARVMVSVLGDETTQRATLEGLTPATGYIRHEVSRRLRVRRIPEFTFHLDQGPEEGIRIEQLLEGLHKEEGSR